MEPTTLISANEQSKRSVARGSSIGLVTYCVLFAAVIYFVPQGSPYYGLVVDSGQVIMPIVAAATAWAACRSSSDHRGRWAWGLISASAAIWVVGQAIWVYSTYLSPTNSPMRLAQAFWELWYPVAFVAVILMLPKTGSRSYRTLSVIDALIFTVGALGLVWRVLLVPAIQPSVDSLDVAIGISWLAGDLLLLFPVISLVLLSAFTQIRISSLFLLSGFAANLIADTGFAMGGVSGAYKAGLPTDPFWAIAFALLSMAALLRIRESAPDSGPLHVPGLSPASAGLGTALSYMALPAAALLLFVCYFDNSRHGTDQSTVALAIALFLMVMATLRQYLTYQDLSRRTRELEAMHYAATRLSHCTDSTQVLHTGLQVAGEALNAAGGMVWVVEANGAIAPAGALGLSARTQESVNECCKNRDALEEVLASSSPSQLTSQTACGSWEGVGAINSLLLVPMISRGDVLGVVGLAGRKAKTFENADLKLATAIASQIGMALENSRRFEEVKLLADRDSVTGLLNHRRVLERLDEEIARIRRTGGPLSVVMMDLDGFKQLNDTYGHPAGDDMLQLIGNLLLGVVRASDIVGRYGGDEFIAILTGTDAAGARLVAERMRIELERTPYSTGYGVFVPLRMSFGIATYPDSGLESQHLVEIADNNLYKSKQRGGDTVTCGPAPREVQVN